MIYPINDEEVLIIITKRATYEVESELEITGKNKLSVLSGS